MEPMLGMLITIFIFSPRKAPKRQNASLSDPTKPSKSSLATNAKKLSKTHLQVSSNPIKPKATN